MIRNTCIFSAFILTLLTAPSGAYDCRLRKYTAMTGSFSSPNHPNPYPNNAKCTYFIKAKADHYVEITFVKFKLEYSFEGEDRTDYVQIYDGREKNRKQEVYFGGTIDTPKKFVSKTGRVFVNFFSNKEFAFSGFKATYRMISRSKCEASTLKIEHGSATCDADETGLATSCQVTCDDTYVLHGLAKVFCNDAEFVAPPTCEPDPTYHCDIKKIEKLNKTCTKDPVTGRLEECKITCQHPHALLGNDTIVCGKNGLWDNVPECLPDPDVLETCMKDPDDGDCLFTREEVVEFQEAFFEEMQFFNPLIAGKTVDGTRYGCPPKLCWMRKSTKSFYYECDSYSRKLQKRYRLSDSKKKARMTHCFKCQSVRCLKAVHIFS